MNTDRLKARIAALRLKTTAAGCTEAEALAAAEGAARLMQEHGLSAADLVMVESQIRVDEMRATWRSKLSDTISYVTNTSAFVIRQPYAYSVITFYGRAPGPEIAVYLRDVCVRAVEHELKGFKDTTFYRRRRSLKTKRAATADFADGMVLRLEGRLREMFRASGDAQALLEAAAERDRRNPGGVDFKPPVRETRFDDARAHGYQAGDRVRLNHGVSNERFRQLGWSGKR